MSEQTPYEQLGVTEESSFEEIQTARDRLATQHEGDLRQLERIETAYDAVLMERLRLRQEGRIKVPDRIRFPEKSTLSTSPVTTPAAKTPGWLQGWLDTPSQADIWLPAGIFTALGALVVFAPSLNTLQIALMGGLGTGFYFLFRKERKLGRSVLISLVALMLGFLAGGILSTVLQVQLIGLGLRPEIFVTVLTFVILWIVSSFLR